LLFCNVECCEQYDQSAVGRDRACLRLCIQIGRGKHSMKQVVSPWQRTPCRPKGQKYHRIWQINRCRQLTKPVSFVKTEEVRQSHIASRFLWLLGARHRKLSKLRCIPAKIDQHRSPRNSAFYRVDRTKLNAIDVPMIKFKLQSVARQERFSSLPTFSLRRFAREWYGDIPLVYGYI
jgi:hypothetical protein